MRENSISQFFENLIFLDICKLRELVQEDFEHLKCCSDFHIKQQISYFFLTIFMILNFFSPIDVWAAGIVFLSILSTRYPFFKNQDDDLTALGELVTIFGSAEMQKSAIAIGKKTCRKTNIGKGRKFTSSIDYAKVPLKELCEKLSSVKRKIPNSAYDLLERCLDLNPYTRITAKDAMSHFFFKEE
jgi:serine/threonine protein kinase